MTEEEFKVDVNNVIYSVVDYNSVASRIYDEVVAEYIRYGEEAGYQLMKELLEREQIWDTE